MDSENLKIEKYRESSSTGSNRNDTAESIDNSEQPAMLHLGGDVANVMDLLDFIVDKEERKQIKINYVLQHVVPLFNFPSCADEETLSQDMEEDDMEEHLPSRTENNVSTLSEKNLLRHNLAGRCGRRQLYGKEF